MIAGPFLVAGYRNPFRVSPSRVLNWTLCWPAMMYSSDQNPRRQLFLDQSNKYVLIVSHLSSHVWALCFGVIVVVKFIALENVSPLTPYLTAHLSVSDDLTNENPLNLMLFINKGPCLSLSQTVLLIHAAFCNRFSFDWSFYGYILLHIILLCFILHYTT